MGTVLPFPGPASRGQTTEGQVGFSRFELKRIVDLYGRMVAAGLWKDYAVELRPDAAAFWAFRRTAERPEYRIEKRPGGRHGSRSGVLRVPVAAPAPRSGGCDRAPPFAARDATAARNAHVG